MKQVTWLLEPGVFGATYGLPEAVHTSGDRVVLWDDAWWDTQRWPIADDEPVVFHGSLSNAARIAERKRWHPGAFCKVEAFYCTEWYPHAAPWLLNTGWRKTSAAEWAAHGASTPMFVRPDSPLKPFSGRVVAPEKVSLAAIDYGFYFEDPNLPVIVAPERTISREWRYIVVKGQVAAGSAYEATGRRPIADDPTGTPWKFASHIATKLRPPESVYVLDVCESDGELKILELNPFSGADLYACDLHAVVNAVSTAVLGDS